MSSDSGAVNVRAENDDMGNGCARGANGAKGAPYHGGRHRTSPTKRPCAPKRERVIEENDDGGRHLDALPVEILLAVMAWMTAPTVGATAQVCRAFGEAARCEHLWRALYRRDFAIEAPPPEHQDYARHGKTVRWLYAVAAAGAHPDRLLHNVTLGRSVGRVESADGREVWSGEFAFFPESPFARRGQHYLHGYGAHVKYNRQTTPMATTKGAKEKESARSAHAATIREGVWSKDELVGPGRVQRNKWITRCDTFVAGQPTGHVVQVHVQKDESYEGGFADDMREGVGIYRWHRSGSWSMGERSAGKPLGRCIVHRAHSSLVTYSGHAHDSKYTRHGVQRHSDGMVQECLRDEDGALVCSTKRPGRPSGQYVASRYLYGADDRPRIQMTACANGFHITSLYDAQGAIETRSDASTGLLVAWPGHLVLVALADSIPDRRLAGRRFFADHGPRWVTVPEAAADTGGAIPADASLHMARAFYLYLASPYCMHYVHVARRLSDALVRAAANAGVSLEWTQQDDQLNEARLHNAHLELSPYGLYLPVASVPDQSDAPNRIPPKEKTPTHREADQCEVSASRPPDSGQTVDAGQTPHSPTRHSVGGALVRCFLRGGTAVPAVDCAFLSSGRLYTVSALGAWSGSGAAHAHTDPQTGETLVVPRLVIPWRPWMQRVGAEVLCDLVQRMCVPLGDHAPSQIHEWAHVVTERIRHQVAMWSGAYRAPVPRALDALVGEAIAHGRLDALTQSCVVAPFTDGKEKSDDLVRGFDGVVVRNIELRHPGWDPRGPWRFGTPSVPLPPDDTVDEHERPDAGPLDHWHSHGIARLALVASLFVGAQLAGVFFVGQRLHGCSFVGARLDRCAFVGCHFVRCPFADAVLTECTFYDCHYVHHGQSVAIHSERDVRLRVAQNDGLL